MNLDSRLVMLPGSTGERKCAGDLRVGRVKRKALGNYLKATDLTKCMPTLDLLESLLGENICQN